MKKVVLYISGGTMRGIFGAGVVTTLEKANVYNRIEAVYASSAGALTAAYFLARQTRLGSSIFYEDLTHDFISTSGFWGGIWDRLLLPVIPSLAHEPPRDALDIDYLFKVIEKKKPLGKEVVTNCGIPLYVKLFNLDQGKIEYVKLSPSNTLPVLRASVTMMPYVFVPSVLNGEHYCDASLIDQIGIAHLQALHPYNPIVAIFNGDPHFTWKGYLKKHVEGFFAERMRGASFHEFFVYALTHLQNDLKLAREDDNIYLAMIPKESPIRTRTTSRQILHDVYMQGKKEGERVVRWLGNA